MGQSCCSKRLAGLMLCSGSRMPLHTSSLLLQADLGSAGCAGCSVTWAAQRSVEATAPHAG